ncbi:MAG: phage pi2 protein 07 [Saprospiraceae bacterium]|jgi:phage pi2 protein 07|tara:strand:+ start:682 stop:1035 length:354 start_codon:yes stop_codon:yes gene_type:complete
MKKAESYIVLEHELDTYRKIMTQAANVILDQDVSKYPIMVAHQQELELGMPIFNREENKGSKWSIHASSLEEFVSKQIVYPDKVEEFKSNYKSIDSSVCVFVLSELGAEFIFLPIKK